jgi:threonine/homoserine/homoserine lactone efflux protein
VEFVVAGLGLGLGAGLAPGPLLALVITTTLARGFRAGARVAFSPLVTDALVIAVSLLVVRSLPDRAAAALGVAGGLYVVWLGIEALRDKPVDVEAPPTDGPDPLRRGALVNLLSPHPWLFWIAVGGPLLVAAWASSPPAAVGFLVAFFSLLIGCKVAIAALVAGGSSRLGAHGLRRAHIAAGVLLLLTGAVLVAEFAPALVAG